MELFDREFYYFICDSPEARQYHAIRGAFELAGEIAWLLRMN